jgi:hypothetical protein
MARSMASCGTLPGKRDAELAELSKRAPQATAVSYRVVPDPE